LAADLIDPAECRIVSKIAPPDNRIECTGIECSAFSIADLQNGFLSPKRVAPIGIYDSSNQKGISNLAGSHTHYNISVLNPFG